MKTYITILSVCGSLWLSGCAGTRRASIGIASAGIGAFAGNKLGHGKPLSVVAGASAGVLAGEALNYASELQNKTAYAEGFEKGRSDAAKQQYWIMVNHQKRSGEGIGEDCVNFYEIPIPERQVEGVTLNPATRILRIEE
jgi:hypothetical protein